MNEIITVRDLAMVTSDIQYAQRQGARQLASNLIEIGRLLVEARDMVKPGEWEKYIWDNFGYSTSSADNWMKLYREYGTNQESLFDSFTNSQTFGKLSYTQLLALTALPTEERSEFVEQHDVENMSTRQLQQAIRERDEAREQAAKVQMSADTMARQLQKAKKDRSDLQEENARLVEQAKRAKDNAKEDVKRYNRAVKEAEARETQALAELENLKANPEVPEDLMAAMRKEAQAEAAKQAAETTRKALEAAEKRALEAEKARQAAEAQLNSGRREITMSNPDVAVFKSMIQQVQADFKRLTDSQKKIAQADPATGVNLKEVLFELLDRLRGEVG